MDDILSITEISQEIRPSLGERGEGLAADFLEQNGYRIVVKNFKVPVGRNSKGVAVTGEIDIIALDAGTLCFVEVKTRRSADFTPVIANVDRRKQRQISRTARIYRNIFHIRDMPHRFDAVTVLMPKFAEPDLSLIKGLWNDSVFRKHVWHGDAWQDL